MERIIVFLNLSVLLVLSGCATIRPISVQGYPAVWHAQTLSFKGPLTTEARETFTDYRLDVTFSHSDGDKIVVAGYYAADGNAKETSATSGNVWHTKFVPNKPGAWTYTTDFRKGPNIALDRNLRGESAGYFDAVTGRIDIDAAQINHASQDFRQRGVLKDVRERYLQFQGTQSYFLKTGAGSPENILAYEDFDGTYDAGGTNFPALGESQLHKFKPHVRDAAKGDPIWKDGKGKALLGLINYLSEVYVNAQYMLLMNVEGDGQDVWPWVSHETPYVYDVSKLAQWDIVMSHMDHKGVVKDIILGETENESWFEVTDNTNPKFSDMRKLYYREMVARFGHHLGLVWNLGEEHGVDGNSGDERYRKATTAEQRIAFIKYIADLDPYDHAIVSHNWPDSEMETYGPKLGLDEFTGISLQAHHDYAEKIIDWTSKSNSAGRPWTISVDEPLGWEFGARPDTEDPSHEDAILTVLWPTLLAGGTGVDWYFGWQNNAATSDLSNEDMRSRHNLWVQSADIRRWWEANIPFQDMYGKWDEDTKTLSFSLPDGDETELNYTKLEWLPEDKVLRVHRDCGIVEIINPMDVFE